MPDPEPEPTRPDGAPSPSREASGASSQAILARWRARRRRRALRALMAAALSLLIVALVLYASGYLYMRNGTRPFTCLRFPQARIDIYSYSRVMAMRSPDGGAVYPVHTLTGEIRAGWLVALGGSSVESTDDVVTIDGIEYGAATGRGRSLLISRNGEVSEGAIRAIDRREWWMRTFYPYMWHHGG